MNPTTQSHETLQDDKYFRWEFNARLMLARKELLDHIAVKPEASEWKVADQKALALIAKVLSPNYQSMIRDCQSAAEAWFKLREFFVNLHNRVQLRKQLHEFQVASRDNIMDHLMKFDDLCMRLSAVGDEGREYERLVILLGSLTSDYDSMVKIIEARGNTYLHETKEMLRREYDTVQKREKEESAFQAISGTSQGGRCQNGGRLNRRWSRDSGDRRPRMVPSGRGKFPGRCFECDGIGHKRAECPKMKKQTKDDEFVFSVTGSVDSAMMWLLDSGASSHMTFDRSDFEEFRPISGSMDVLVESGQRFAVSGVGVVRLQLRDGGVIVVNDVLYIPGLDRKLLSVPALTAKGAQVTFGKHDGVIGFKGSIVARCTKLGKLFVLAVEKLELNQKDEALAVVADETTLWHVTWGSNGSAALTKLRPVFHTCQVNTRLMLLVKDNIDQCCEGKFPLEVVHSDLMGPMETASKGGARYALVFVDD
ncbi:LOW QUALITY PROTEIN: polyprotein [Phytophthora megakarya]|uniref:Polyprotein n=1 Tax=Phytophthora megakarya TaxID=4795 RepID=A0A225WC75_9STRA|nr:LOW QUALITY PROTEIN: polyprotein [Phytophthora megakarya]